MCKCDEKGDCFGRSCGGTGTHPLFGLFYLFFSDNWGHLGGAIGGAAMAYYFGPRLFLASYPDEGGRVIVDKPVMRLPSALENIPRNLSNGFSRIVRRMQIWRVKEGLPGKPWSPEYQRRADYERRIYNTPNRSIKPKLDNFE